MRAPGGAFSIEDVELDEPRADELLVRLVACGICHTDLGMRRGWALIPGNEGRYPVVFGHEGAGIVEGVGAAVERVRPGDAVVMSYRSCRRCPECAAGHPSCCAHFAALNAGGVRPDGSTTMRAGGRAVHGSFFGQSSFATHALAYEDNVVVVDAGVDLAVAAPFGCSVQTGAGTVMNVLPPGERARLVVFGAGAVGLPAVMAARALDVTHVVVVDPVRARRELARELGATATIDPQAGDVVERVREHTGGGATAAIETTAIPDVLLQALDCLGALGTCVSLGVGIPEFPLDMRRLARGRSLRTSIEGDADPHDFIPRLLDLHAAGLLPVERLIRSYRFDDIARAAEEAESGAAIKPVLVF